MLTLTCSCGCVIPTQDIEFLLGCNEDGEDFTELEVICPTCNTTFETSTWGDVENSDEAIELLQNVINNK